LSRLIFFSQTFHWLWPPLIQERLDLFREYWNNHRLSHSPNKVLPSGYSPQHMFLVPQAVRHDAQNCSIRVNPDTVRELREAYGGQEARDRLFRFVSQEFQEAADSVYVEMGCPIISLESAWDVFKMVVERLAS
jgi:hypothetical protein